MRFTLSFLALALGVTSLAAAALGANTVPPLPVPDGAVVILNTGSADLAGYRIVISPSGKTESIDGAGRGKGQVRQDLADALFRDLAAAGPLAKIAAAGCAANRATPQTMLLWHGDQSPDLSCASAGSALFGDVQAIARALYVANYHSKPMSVFVTPGSAGSASQQVVPVATPAPAPASGGYGGGYGGMGGHMLWYAGL